YADAIKKQGRGIQFQLGSSESVMKKHRTDLMREQPVLPLANLVCGGGSRPSFLQVEKKVMFEAFLAGMSSNSLNLAIIGESPKNLPILMLAKYRFLAIEYTSANHNF
ncbi:hypothetical protein Ciccas_012506, partial [Cichlidogyrus casuarinus]